MPVERTLAEEGRMVGLQFNWIVLDQRWKYSSISLFWKYWNLSLETGDKLYSDTPPPEGECSIVSPTSILPLFVISIHITIRCKSN